MSSLRAGSPSASPCLVADRLREAGLVDAAKAAYTDLLKAADTTVAGARCARAGLGQLGLGTEVPKASAAVACAVPDAFRRVGLDVEAKAAYKQILSSNGPGSAATMCAQRGLDRMRSFGDRFDDVVQALVNGLLGTERSLSPRDRAVIPGIFGGTSVLSTSCSCGLRGSSSCEGAAARANRGGAADQRHRPGEGRTRRHRRDAGTVGYRRRIPPVEGHAGRHNRRHREGGRSDRKERRRASRRRRPSDEGIRYRRGTHVGLTARGRC